MNHYLLSFPEGVKIKCTTLTSMYQDMILYFYCRESIHITHTQENILIIFMFYVVLDKEQLISYIIQLSP